MRRVDTPVWVTVLVGVLTAGATYLAGVRPARIAAREAAADRDLALQERSDDREQWFVDRIDRAWELCRSSDEQEQRAGVRLLRALLQEPRLTRLVSNILDEVTSEVFGDDLGDLRADWERTGRVPDAVARSADPAARHDAGVTRLQVELARAQVAADGARSRTPDPLLVQVAAVAVPDDEPPAAAQR